MIRITRWLVLPLVVATTGFARGSWSFPALSPSQEAVLTYDAGLEAVRNSIREGRFSQAEAQLKDLLARFPNNPELLSLLGRVLFWQRKYDEAKKTYADALRLRDDESLREELERVNVAQTLLEADVLLEQGRTREAESRLVDLFSSGKEQYESGYRLGMLYLKKREYTKAKDIFNRLRLLFPTDTGFSGLYLESLIVAGELDTAQRELNLLPVQTRIELEMTRPDLFYRLSKNFVKLGASAARYDRNRGNEHELRIDVAQRVGTLPCVVSLARINRYGLQDSQIGVEVYSPVGEKSRNWGYLAFAFSPGADFLPNLTLGGEITRGFANFDLSFGYRRMAFAGTYVDLLIPRVTAYLPQGFSLNEQVYVLLKQNSISLLSTLHYEPHHKFRAFISLGAGRVSERLRSREDLKNVKSFSAKVGLEYRFLRHWGVGLDMFYEERKNLYRQDGIAIYTKAWW